MTAMVLSCCLGESLLLDEAQPLLQRDRAPLRLIGTLTLLMGTLTLFMGTLTLLMRLIGTLTRPHHLVDQGEDVFLLLPLIVAAALIGPLMNGSGSEKDGSKSLVR